MSLGRFLIVDLVLVAGLALGTYVFLIAPPWIGTVALGLLSLHATVVTRRKQPAKVRALLGDVGRGVKLGGAR